MATTDASGAADAIVLKHADVSVNELSHYGIKGMKWGVRRSQATLDRLAGRTPSKKRKKSSDRVGSGNTAKKIGKKAGKAAGTLAKNATKKVSEARAKRKRNKAVERANEAAKSKKISQMSNEELKSHIDRLTLEKKYNELTGTKKNTTARDLVGDFFGKSSQKIVEKSAEALATEVVKTFTGQVISTDDKKKKKK